MKTKILVTGGTGFIGTHLVSRLVQAGHSVRSLSRTAPKHPVPGAEYIVGDCFKEETARANLEGVDAIYHLAVSSVPGNSNVDVLLDAKTNFLGTLSLVQAACDVGIKRFIFLSSGGSIYGVTPQTPIPETKVAVPISAHGASKVAVTRYLSVFENLGGLDYRVARVANPFGPGQDPRKGQGFISRALFCLLQDREIEVWGDGSVTRDFFYVDDLIEALELLLANDGEHKIYNIGSGVPRTVNEVMETLRDITGRKAKVIYKPKRGEDVPYNCLDISRARNYLHWQPKTSFEDGVRRHWQWIEALGT